jgi:hypothetical protein
MHRRCGGAKHDSGAQGVIAEQDGDETARGSVTKTDVYQ